MSAIGVIDGDTRALHCSSYGVEDEMLCERKFPGGKSCNLKTMDPKPSREVAVAR